MLAKTGEVASSKSAMNTFAPEFSALTIILRSTGPVISTRRSRRSAGIGATFQSPSRMARVSGRKSGVSPASKGFWRSMRGVEQFAAALVESAVQLGEEGERGGGEDFVEAGPLRTEDRDAGGGIDQGGNAHSRPSLSLHIAAFGRSYRKFLAGDIEPASDQEIGNGGETPPRSGPSVVAAMRRPWAGARPRRARASREMDGRVVVERPCGEVDEILPRQADVAQFVFGEAGQLRERRAAPRSRGPARAGAQRRRARADRTASDGVRPSSGQIVAKCGHRTSPSAKRSRSPPGGRGGLRVRRA